MKITVILMTDGEWCRADSYEEALDRLDRRINEDYYREQRELQDGKASGPELYDKEEVVPKAMILTDDETAEIDRYGQLLTEAGCWHVTIPLVGKRPPSPDYRFSIMQDLKDKDFKEELENHLVATYGAEFDKFCHKEMDESIARGIVVGSCEGCEFNGSKKNDNGELTCFMKWYEKYKKPERDKEKKENG